MGLSLISPGTLTKFKETFLSLLLFVAAASPILNLGIRENLNAAFQPKTISLRNLSF